MAVLQYVGARYVPKLFKAPDGSMEWQPDTYYEPLTIVTYLNASYISRVPIQPDSPNPAINDEWAMSGVFNAYVSDLSDRVAMLELMGLKSVKSFGAKGDGVTDDTVSFAAAIKSGYLLIGSGTYKVSSTLNVDCPVLGIDAKLITDANFSGSLLKIIAPCTVQGISVVNSGSGDAIEVNYSDVPTSQTVIDGVYAKAEMGDGIHVLNKAWIVNISNCLVENSVNGINLATSDNIVENCFIEDCRYGIRVTASNNKILQCKCYTCGYSHYLKTQNDNSNGVIISGAQRIQVSNVETQDTIGNGFLMQNCSHLLVDNCLSDRDSVINSYIQSYSKPAVVASNVIDSYLDISVDDYRGDSLKQCWDISGAQIRYSGFKKSVPGFDSVSGDNIIDMTLMSEIYRYQIANGTVFSTIDAFRAVNGTYEGYVFRPNTGDPNTSQFVVDMNLKSNTVNLALNYSAPQFFKLYYKIADESGTVYNSPGTTVGAGPATYVLTYTHTVPIKYVAIAFDKIQDYTINNVVSYNDKSGLSNDAWSQIALTTAINH